MKATPAKAFWIFAALLAVGGAVRVAMKLFEGFAESDERGWELLRIVGGTLAGIALFYLLFELTMAIRLVWAWLVVRRRVPSAAVFIGRRVVSLDVSFRGAWRTPATDYFLVAVRATDAQVFSANPFGPKRLDAFAIDRPRVAFTPGRTPLSSAPTALLERGGEGGSSEVFAFRALNPRFVLRAVGPNHVRARFAAAGIDAQVQGID